MITPIITVVEADVFLAAYPDWLALDDPTKETHIYNASLYIQTGWSCAVNGVDIDWTDTANIPEEIKQACAYYALADSTGNLYGDVQVTPTATGRLTKKMVKAGSVTVDKEYAASGSASIAGAAGSFGLPDDLMSIYCTGTGAGSQALLRN